MTAATRLGLVTLKIATATSVIRTRSQDASRIQVHGGHNGELEARHAAAVARIEAVAAKLEKLIA